MKEDEIKAKDESFQAEIDAEKEDEVDASESKAWQFGDGEVTLIVENNTIKDPIQISFLQEPKLSTLGQEAESETKSYPANTLVQMQIEAATLSSLEKVPQFVN